MKRNLKKAKKNGLIVKEIKDENELELLTLIYIKMSESRGVSLFDQNSMRSILKYYYKSIKGIVYGCYLDDDIVGGAVVTFYGQIAEYFLGFTHPKFRKLPQSHLTIYHAILSSKEKGYHSFDLGGIVTNALESDQVFHITKFKLNFSQNIKPYFPLSNIVFNPFLFFLKQLYLKIA